MKRKSYRPPRRWKALGLLFHFVIKLSKTIKNFVVILGLGGVNVNIKPGNPMLSLITYLTPFLGHDAPT
jgi:hypothetical protein